MTSIIPYHLRDIVVRGGINEIIGLQGIDTTLDFTELVARYLIIFHGRGWGTHLGEAVQ